MHDAGALTSSLAVDISDRMVSNRVDSGRADGIISLRIFCASVISGLSERAEYGKSSIADLAVPRAELRAVPRAEPRAELRAETLADTMAVPVSASPVRLAILSRAERAVSGLGFELAGLYGCVVDIKLEVWWK